MTDRAEFDRVASALALAYRAQPDVAARQMKNSLAFIAATSGLNPTLGTLGFWRR